MARRNDTQLLTPAEQIVFNIFGVRIRFAAAAASLIFIVVSTFAGFYPEYPRFGVGMLTTFVLGYNTAAWLALRNLRRGGSLAEHREQAITKLQHGITLLDQLTLTVSLYLLGGLEIFVLPVILLAMFMVAINTGKRESYWFFASSLTLVGGFFLLQHYGVIDYHSALPTSLMGLPGYHESPITSGWLAMSATWLILAALLFGVIYFSNFIKDKYARVFEEILAGRQEITSLRKLSADILDIFPFAVVIAGGEDGRIEAANPAAVTMLGAHPGWVGRDIRTVEELQSSGLSLYAERALRGEESKVTDFPLVLPGGRKKIYLAVSVFVARKASGAPDKILFCAEDITERLRRESEQRELQQALLQTEKMASLGQMAAGVAHELNNPLTAIDAYGQYLHYRLKNGETIGSESMQRVERIMENSERIRILVKNLLSYARPAPETSVPLSLSRIVDEALGFVDHDIRKRGIEVIKEMDETLRVHGNKTQLQQVFVNLFANAIQAMTPDQGQLRIRVHAVNDKIEAEVSDNGCGIDRKILDRIFEPFFTTKPVGEGTGLGLSIVNTILEKHDGTVQIESEPGKGTTFRLTLPALSM